MKKHNRIVVLIGSEGLLGKALLEGLKEDYLCIRADIGLKDSADQFCYHLDINSKESIVDFTQKIEQNHGEISSVINLAYPRNSQYGRSFFDVEYGDFCENSNLHLGGYFLVLQQFSRYFLNKGQGNIIQFSSIYGVMAPKFEVYKDTSMTMPVEYAAIKAGIIHLGKYVAKFLKGSGIRVNTISPGGIFDHQNELFLKQYNENSLSKGMLDPKDLLGGVRFLLGEDSLFYNGQNLIVDDGFSL